MAHHGLPALVLAVGLGLGACRDDDGGHPTGAPKATAATGDTGDTGDSGTCADDPGWPEAQGYLRTWCLPCHSATVAEDDRQGAPLGVDFDTYAQVYVWRVAIEERATGPEADMPPVPGATEEAIERFARWLACGAEGTDDVPAPCEELVPAEGAPTSLDSAADADAFCAAGNTAPGDLTVQVDVPCLCAVDGDLTLGGVAAPLLGSVAGDLLLRDGAASLPELRHVGGDVTTAATASGAALGSLAMVDGTVSITAGTPVEVDLAGLLTVGGDLVVTALPTVERVDLSRLRVVGGALRLVELPTLTDLEGLVAVESIGRGPVDIGGTASGPDQGGIELVGLGLPALDAFRLLTSVGGPVRIVDNPLLADIDGFTTLPRTDHAIQVTGNPSLAGLEGFDLLEVAHDVEVIDNPLLPNVFGFVNLREAGVVAVEGSPALRSLAGLEELRHVGGLRLIDLDLQDVPWFTELHTVDGDIVLSNLPSLGRVSGLTAVAHIGGDLRVRLDPSLRELRGSGALTSIDGSVSLDTLSALQDASLLQAVPEIGGDLRVVGTGLADLDDLGALDFVGGDLQIQLNPNLPTAEADAFATGVSVDGSVLVGDNGP